MEALDLQDDELAALQSIYPDLVQIQQRDETEGKHLVNLSIPVELPGPTETQLTSPRQQQGGSVPSLTLSHLPPLSARLVLPPHYPVASPPKILSLRAPLPQGQTGGGWLSRRLLDAVQDRLRVLWEEEKELGGGEGTGVLWRWWEWIGSGEFLNDLGLMTDSVLRLSAPLHIPPSSFHLLLKSHNAATSRADFEGTAFPCEICFENPKGRKCFQLPGCGCVFCHACLSSFWTLAIEEGTLQSVACPAVSCVKERAGKVDHAAGAHALERNDGISMEVVESVVGKDLARRWRLLSEKRLVDTDPTYTFCPRENCQAPVPATTGPAPTETHTPSPPKAKFISIEIKDATVASVPAHRARQRTPPSDVARAIAESRWENFRKCPRCTYVFCILCRCLWHGAHTPCEIKDAQLAVQEYLKADEEGKAAIEKRLGPRNTEALHALVRDWEREQLVLGWINENTTACPCCRTQIEKSEGCNHMTCARCNTHFCYRCAQTLPASSPYQHFNTPGKPCYNKLFDFDPNEHDFWVPMEFGEI